MKNFGSKLVFTFVFFICAFNILNAQSYKINLYSAYTLDDDVNAVTDGNNYYSGTVVGGYQWGLGFEYIVKPTYGLELAYFRQDADVDISYSTNYTVNNNIKNESTFGTGLNWIFLGGNKYLPVPGSIVQPYGGLMLGMAIFSSDDKQINDTVKYTGQSTTNFAWAGRVGANFMFSPNVGLKLQAQVMSAVQSFGGGLYAGTGGLGAGVDTESSMYQFGFGGALVIQFGGSSTKVRKR
ncbi:MAG: porin family protein [Ignavibacteria bacterium]|nr:porin family protein [Ignavibacteria bacterium]